MKVLLAMPRYNGLCHLAAATAFYHPLGEGSKLTTKLTDSGGSLLAASFNGPWADAVDRYERGECDAFAMIHADVGAEACWLDTLYREMTDYGADAISAVVPIKDDRGLTSTAKENRRDQWIVRRLTMTEVLALPMTFGDAEIGGEILLNTGLWMVKLGPWCLEENPNGTLKYLFSIKDCIRREKLKDGTWKRKVRVRPEDWEFSRDMRVAGLKLAATRAVRVLHYGDTFYPNDVAWGWPNDLQNGPEVEQAEVYRPELVLA